ncbi:MAG: hypothetical protein ABII00_10435 [Elusimicrobiota bacterium]
MAALCLLLWPAVPAANAAPEGVRHGAPAGVDAAPVWAAEGGPGNPEGPSRFSGWRLDGSMSLNWRNVGPREPGFETQIQNEVYLADMYFGVRGPVLDGVPFLMEFNMPTGGQGQLSLYRFLFHYDRLPSWAFWGGKFLVPFGRHNELYRPDMFLTVTRPLLYASPDSLDLVVRINSPRPPFSSGYTDIGARVTYYPPEHRWFIPSEATLFVVNGLSESSNRQRTFPTPENLGIPPPPPNGVSIDFGHENNNLADNNNNKVPGGRVVFALGDLDLPWPIPEGQRDLNGLLLGVSAMGGQYELEAVLNYMMIGVDLGFEYQGVNVTAEYMHSFTHFKSPLEAAPSSTTLLTPTIFVRDYEEIQGFFIQGSFPLIRAPRWGRRVTGVVVYNRAYRRGPLLDLLLNQTVNGEFFESIAAYNPVAPRIERRVTKYTAGLNWQLSDHFILKGEYSYWAMGASSTITGTRDIYQGAFSVVMGF